MSNSGISGVPLPSGIMPRCSCGRRSIKPDEVYNLAAQSHVQVSFQTPEYTAQASGVGVLNILEAIRAAGIIEHVKFYQASTSELYGKVHEIPQSETTPFHPRSPYAVAKLYGFWCVACALMHACMALHAEHVLIMCHICSHALTRRITWAPCAQDCQELQARFGWEGSSMVSFHKSSCGVSASSKASSICVLSELWGCTGSCYGGQHLNTTRD